MRHFITFPEKFAIVEAAYSIPRNVRNTARNYGVDDKQIRKWRVIMLALTDAERLALRDKMTIHKGKVAIDDDIEGNLREFFTVERSFQRRVTPKMLVRKAAILKPNLMEVTADARMSRIHLCAVHSNDR